jgi:hypothetical protein
MMWQLRPPTEQDVSFIFNSWMKSFRDGPAMTGIGNTLYYKEMQKCIEAVIKSEGCRAVVACSPANGDENVIFGYGIGEETTAGLVLHWVYVKHPFRGFGVGKAIETELLKVPHESVTYSCHSKLCRALLKSRNDYVYNPFTLWSHK